MSALRNRYFSVGEYCATAHQIRRVCGADEAYFFDWLVTRGDSFKVVRQPEEQGEDAPMLSGDWSVEDRGLRLLDGDSGLLFQHEFEVDANKAIDAVRVPAHLPVARQKFEYLRAKLRSALAECDRGVLVRAENGLTDLSSAQMRLEQLRGVFSVLQPGLKYVLASTQLRQEHTGEDHLFVRLSNPNPPTGADAWKGDNASWDRLFQLAEAHLG
jgi:hypothetical protein